MAFHHALLPAVRPDTMTRPPLRFLALLALVLAAFALAPWSLEEKTSAALHGLCAQRPSHSFTFDGRYLPLDARMTGIYGGFVITSLHLGIRGRYRALRFPGRPTLIALGALVGIMAIDGINSTLLDLRLWHPYEPSNLYRLLSGLGVGIALAAAICYLLAITLWRSGRTDQKTVTGPGELGLLALLQAPFALLVLSGVPWLYAPVVWLLLAAATTAVGALMLVLVVLIARREGTVSSVGQLDGPATVALVLASVMMAGIAVGRFLLERLTDAPPPM